MVGPLVVAAADDQAGPVVVDAQGLRPVHVVGIALRCVVGICRQDMEPGALLTDQGFVIQLPGKGPLVDRQPIGHADATRGEHVIAAAERPSEGMELRRDERRRVEVAAFAMQLLAGLGQGAGEEAAPLRRPQQGVLQPHAVGKTVAFIDRLDGLHVRVDGMYQEIQTALESLAGGWQGILAMELRHTAHADVLVAGGGAGVLGEIAGGRLDLQVSQHGLLDLAGQPALAEKLGLLVADGEPAEVMIRAGARPGTGLAKVVAHPVDQASTDWRLRAIVSRQRASCDLPARSPINW